MPLRRRRRRSLSPAAISISGHSSKQPLHPGTERQDFGIALVGDDSLAALAPEVQCCALLRVVAVAPNDTLFRSMSDRLRDPSLFAAHAFLLVFNARRRISESAPRRSRARREPDDDRASFGGDASS